MKIGKEFTAEVIIKVLKGHDAELLEMRRGKSVWMKGVGFIPRIIPMKGTKSPTIKRK